MWERTKQRRITKLRCQEGIEYEYAIEFSDNPEELAHGAIDNYEHTATGNLKQKEEDSGMYILGR
eukprot:6691286-Prorocentrum_lima.AAC.1